MALESRPQVSFELPPMLKPPKAYGIGVLWGSSGSGKSLILERRFGHKREVLPEWEVSSSTPLSSERAAPSRCPTLTTRIAVPARSSHHRPGASRPQGSLGTPRCCGVGVRVGHEEAVPCALEGTADAVSRRLGMSRASLRVLQTSSLARDDRVLRGSSPPSSHEHDHEYEWF